MRTAETDRSALQQTLSAATKALLDQRTAQGCWLGELSGSALATATAVFALARADAAEHAPLIRRGIDWLVRSQNDDGGWGDTPVSYSNVSTTVLCWCALAAGEAPSAERKRAAAAAQEYLARHAESLAPDDLARAVADRYGSDRTFSAPILTMCALAGRLGEGRGAWKHVPALPFELAACPHRMLRILRLPVVSYALPALIAIGQARHEHRPTRNPIARLLRRFTRGRTLRILGRIQPESGGFLEAPPLTSFVVMSLASMGLAEGTVAQRGVAFLRASVRDEGCWPIDTNLATWLTTLSVNALAAPAVVGALDAPSGDAVRNWLLAQQHTAEHPYTHAAPGGWAWTDLSGGVPDADDTAGALLALRHLGCDDEVVRSAAAAGCRWLLDLANRDGGIPTFCRGWGRLPFDRSCQDLTAHALLAWSAWLADLPEGLRAAVAAAIGRGTDFLVRSQGHDGQWAPLWFGNQSAPGEENPTYGTARVLMAMRELSRRGPGRVGQSVQSGIAWLLSGQNEDGGWGGAPGIEASIEETALATDALSRFLIGPVPDDSLLPMQAVRRAVRRGADWLIQRTDAGKSFPAAPIGLYFARLWYFEKLYPIIFTVSALARAVEAMEQ